MKKFFTLLFTGLLIFGVIWFYQFYVVGLNYSLDPDSDQRVLVTIKTGSTAEMVAKQLLEAKLIKNATVFKLYLRQNSLEDQLKAGRLVLQENFDLEQIVAALVDGKSVEFSITFPEGWTIEQMAGELESTEMTTAESFLNCIKNCEFDFTFLPDDYLEGYLYPDTYFVNPGTYSDERFINRMLQTLENKISREDWSVIELSERSFEDIMIMASIIEREEHDSEQRPTVADILWSRLDNAVGLGADATVLYALGRTKGGLTYDDLQVDSPYNTRKYRGLPPTPIANPSLSSILAALYPKDSPYFYYLHDADGQIHYARNLDEHNANKAEFL